MSTNIERRWHDTARRLSIDEARKLCDLSGLTLNLTDHFIERINVLSPDQTASTLGLVRAVKQAIKKCEVNQKISIVIDGHAYLLSRHVGGISLVSYFFNAADKHFSEANIKLSAEKFCAAMRSCEPELDPAVVAVFKLAAYGRAMLREHRTDGGGDIDGGQAQDLAERYGVLEKRTVTEPCGEACICGEYGDFPVECFFIPAAVSELMENMK